MWERASKPRWQVVGESLSRRLLWEMIREEWRLNSQLFGGRRFAAFPIIVTILVAGGSVVLVSTGTDPDTVFGGLHLLALLAGLHTGSIGVVGRDAVQDLLGDKTLLMFSARTLPLSRRRLLGVFIVKDVLYYATLFLVPMAVGTLPLLLETGASTWTLAATISVLWATLTVTFVLGIGLTVAGIGVSGTWYGSALAVLVVALLGVGIWLRPVDLVALSPYGIFQAPTVLNVGMTLLAVGVLFGIGALTFEPTSGHRTRTIEPAFDRWVHRVGDPVAAKSILDVSRSGGGLWKVLFSVAILLAVTTALIDFAGVITGVAPSVGLSFGTVLGLSGFTTYNWLTTGDDIDAYTGHPLSVADVFRGKFRAFLLLGPAVGLLFYVLAVLWFGGPVGELVVGGVLLVGVACYVFGVTVLLTGLSPNEFLFDTVLFVTFGLALIVPLVPLLVVAFVISPLTQEILFGLALTGGVLAAVGVGAFRWSLPRWTEYHRT